MTPDMLTSLPTTPGSAVTFDLPPDTDGTIYRAVASLIVGHVSDDGTVHDAVWASAELEAPDDSGCVFDPAVILSSRPELVVETEAVTDSDPIDWESDIDTGTVIHVIEYGVPMTYTYAPSFVYENELRDHFWTNAYGGYWALDTAAEVTVLFAPVRPGP